MNRLEINLCRSVVKAFNTYEKMTGWWLSHAPEHYLQNAIFIHIGRDFELFLEASWKKIIHREGGPRLGRVPRDIGKRYDLVIWYKTKNAMRAVVEVKRSWSLTQAVFEDAERIRDKNADAGYLIIYKEFRAHRDRAYISKTFESWSKRLDLIWMNKDQKILGTDGEWLATFALFRYRAS